MKMPKPVAWADDAVLQGRVGNVCSESAKRYWEKSDWVDRKNAEVHKHPLYDKQALSDMLEAAAAECESAISLIWDYHDDGRKEIGVTVCNNLANNIRKLKETL